MSNWISVNDRLPEEYYGVLVLDANGNIHIAWHSLSFKDNFKESIYENEGDIKISIKRRNVTHWMPLPEPPKKTKK